MAKPGKMTPEERAEQLKREREFQELLEKRKELDEKLAAERKRTAKS
jgi:RNase H-fold protein (predicted Holliday junction resolvase)